MVSPSPLLLLLLQPLAVVEALHDMVALGSSGATSSSRGTGGLRRTNLRRPGSKDVSFFDAFAEEESTYDVDGDHGYAGDPYRPQSQFASGWSPKDQSVIGGMVDSGFFHESMSGGPQEAWQSHYPGLTQGIAGHSASIGTWYQRRGGNWGQSYVSGPGGSTTHGDPWKIMKSKGKLDASWFDASVSQIDGFGRQKFPSQVSPKRLVGWKEVTVNTTLKCAEPGCVANATIQAFNWVTDRAQRCLLSVYFHPTDFDQEHSSETVSWVEVNGVKVSTQCAPSAATGCDANKAKLLYPCVVDVPLDKLMPVTGLLNIAAKIPETVDECPYEGNLLSGVPMVTCMVAPQNPSPLFGKSPNQPPPALQGVEWQVVGQQSASNGADGGVLGGLLGGLVGQQGTSNGAGQQGTSNGAGQQGTSNGAGRRMMFTVHMGCATAGCLAEETIPIYTPTGVKFTKCTMKFIVTQTDFDGSYGREKIEFVKVNTAVVATNIKPGLNPCKAAARGHPLPADKLKFVAVKGVDVTQAVVAGELVVSAKISSTVDECASNGNLLDANVVVECQ